MIHRIYEANKNRYYCLNPCTLNWIRFFLQYNHEETLKVLTFLEVVITLIIWFNDILRVKLIQLLFKYVVSLIQHLKDFLGIK